ncbi:7TM GPCR protein [Aphelenchoides avenae]|nr:7TM GPCR protein [Aphelenchus avenae]
MSGTSVDIEEFNIQKVTSFYSGFSGICLVTGTFLNVLVIWLVCTQSRSLLASFKTVMVQHCVFELVSLFAAVLVQPLFNFVRGRFAMMHNGPLRNVAQPVSFVLTEVWFATLYFCIASNVLQFVYRYLLLCR